VRNPAISSKLCIDQRIDHGFDIDDGASLLMAFRGLKVESVAQGEVHRGIARDLENLVMEPFSEWAERHKDRIYDSRTVLLDEWLRAYEQGQSDVSLYFSPRQLLRIYFQVLYLRNQYHNKIHEADEAEDE
jgi:hypothetical protein